MSDDPPQPPDPMQAYRAQSNLLTEQMVREATRLLRTYFQVQNDLTYGHWEAAKDLLVEMADLSYSEAQRRANRRFRPDPVADRLASDRASANLTAAITRAIGTSIDAFSRSMVTLAEYQMRRYTPPAPDGSQAGAARPPAPAAVSPPDPAPRELPAPTLHRPTRR